MEPDTPIGLQTLKDLDPQRYLACLYLPSAIRNDVASLWAFDAEIRRIPLLVSEPMPGEIRIQWWRDLIKSGGNAGSGPLADALLKAIEKHALPLETFDTYLQARIFDLYQDPMPDKGTLEGYLGETEAVLFQNAAFIAGAARSSSLADASGHSGMARGITAILTNLARHRHRGQIYVPMEILQIYDFDREGWLDGEAGKRHEEVAGHMVSLADEHLKTAAEAVPTLPKDVSGVFLELAVTRSLLNVVQQNLRGLFSAPMRLSLLRQHVALLKAAITGRF